ncbi:MAG: 3-hydroxyacyl-ACP dehydratase [Chitinophagales bacterium]|nr:3-hydroxyacyl-ACP dehydratase [Chitinophagales bacterium]
MNLPVSGNILADLIPQKAPFVLISTLEKIEGNQCVTSFLVEENHVMVKDGKLTEGGLIENIAQTCAAKAGYECALVGLPIPVGFIGDVRNFSCTQLPIVGSNISTVIEVEHKVFDATIISGTVFQDSVAIATCKMKVFEEDKSKSALAESEC